MSGRESRVAGRESGTIDAPEDSRRVSYGLRSVEDSYRYCRAITHRHGANFSVGFRFLPRAKRRAVYASYAFCRWADDIADEGSIDLALKLDDWERELDRCYAGTPTHPITEALADSLRSFDIPKQAFIALLDGCRQDQTKTRYASFAELREYCDLVATSISDISLSIFGFTTPDARLRGRDLATALQLTNVIRDVGDDLGRDRIYLPQDEMARFGITETMLREKAETAVMREFLEWQIARAEDCFRRAEPLLQMLSFDAQFPTVLMGGVYATVLQRIRANPFAVLHRRVGLSKAEKLAVIGKRLLRPHFL